MKIIDALATLDILEESLDMLAEARLQEMEVDALASSLVRRGSPDAVGDALRRGVNLGNLTQGGKSITGTVAVQAMDAALERAGANPAIRRAARVILSDFWSEERVGNPAPAPRSPSAPPATAGAAQAPRTYGTKPAVASNLAQQSINQVSPVERDRLAKQFAAQRREAAARKTHKSV